MLYGIVVKLVEETSSIMQLMHHNYRFNASVVVSYLPLCLLCCLQLARLMWHPIRPCLVLILLLAVLSACFCRLSSSCLFPFSIWSLSFPLLASCFICGLSIMLFSCFIFFYCVVGGRLSLYSFSWLPLTLPLRSAPAISLNCTAPLPVPDFTSYGHS